MHIRKYDFDYGRRKLIQNTLSGAGAGVLTGLWPMLAKSTTLDAGRAYPDELLSIEMHTKGKVKPGDIISKDNLEYVEHLLDPVQVKEVAEMGRKIKIKEATTDVSKLFPAEYLEATLRNDGKAVIDDVGNVRTKDGAPWIGGNAFPDPKTGLQANANICLAWGRHNYAQYAMSTSEINYDGTQDYAYNFVWCEMNVTARPDGSYWRDQTDKLRYQSVWFTKPNEQAGTAFMNVWDYDQRQFPYFVGYIPAFKRIREYPTAQRFEPLVPGMAFYISDTWGAGDPYLTWGNYKIVDRKPMLGAVSDNWHGRQPNWEVPRQGGPKGQSFCDSVMELVPEVIVYEAKPTGYPRSPVGKKVVGVDARNCALHSYVTYDRKGQLWKSVQQAVSQYVAGDKVFKDPTTGQPVWSATWVMFHDIQTHRISLIMMNEQVAGGYKSQWWVKDGEDVYNKYLTKTALRRLGAG